MLAAVRYPFPDHGQFQQSWCCGEEAPGQTSSRQFEAAEQKKALELWPKGSHDTTQSAGAKSVMWEVMKGWEWESGSKVGCRSDQQQDGARYEERAKGCFLTKAMNSEREHGMWCRTGPCQRTLQLGQRSCEARRRISLPPPLRALVSPFWSQNLRVWTSSSLPMRPSSGAEKRQLLCFTSTGPVLTACVPPPGLRRPPVSWMTAGTSYFDIAY